MSAPYETQHDALRSGKRTDAHVRSGYPARRKGRPIAPLLAIDMRPRALALTPRLPSIITLGIFLTRDIIERLVNNTELIYKSAQYAPKRRYRKRRTEERVRFFQYGESTLLNPNRRAGTPTSFVCER